jgi:hypothetical protein
MIDKIAEFMGWRIEGKWLVDPGKGGRQYNTDHYAFATSWDLWMLVEQRIREQGLWKDYIFYLWVELHGLDNFDMKPGHACRSIMSATLEQRASALERVLEERE